MMVFLIRFGNIDVVVKEIGRLVRSDPVSFVDIPDAALVSTHVQEHFTYYL